MKSNVNVCTSCMMYNVNIAFLFLGSQPRLMYDKVGRVNQATFLNFFFALQGFEVQPNMF
jgi:hypothetical protein